MLPFIIACEIGFWLAITLGLTLRYAARKPRLGAAFLIATPLIDIALLIFTVLDLRNGATPHWSHSMAAFYIAFSIIFGRNFIESADRFYQRKFLHVDVPKPEDRKWRQFGLAVVATLIAVAITEVCILLTPIAALGMRDAYKTGVTVLFIWLITGPLWPKRFLRRSAA